MALAFSKAYGISTVFAWESTSHFAQYHSPDHVGSWVCSGGRRLSSVLWASSQERGSPSVGCRLRFGFYAPVVLSSRKRSPPLRKPLLSCNGQNRMATLEARRKLLEETTPSLTRVQEFDPDSIARVEELGTELNFELGVEHAERLVELFKEVSLEVLSELSHQKLTALKQQADAQFNILEQVRQFSASAGLPARDGLLKQLEEGYDAVFEALWPVVAYSVRRTVDFARLDREARAAIQGIKDRTKAQEVALASRVTEAESALDEVRRAAEEQGVSQQASYFKAAADTHAEEADKWLKSTWWLTGLLAAYAIATLFLHNIELMAPGNAYETVQLAVSKVLIFATLASLVLLCARNYRAHRHNSVINSHRRDSLATYRALVEAAGDKANRDIVLARAAETIFGSNSTGYAEADRSGSSSMVSVGPLVRPPTDD